MRIVVGLIALMAKEVCLFGKLTFQKNTFDCLNEQGTRIGPFYRYVSIYDLLHSEYTVLGFLWVTVHRGRDGETYDFSCVSWINNSIIPEPCCGVIRISFSLISFHNLCLKLFLFILVPLQHTCTRIQIYITTSWFKNKIFHQRRTQILPRFLAFSCLSFLSEQGRQQPENSINTCQSTLIAAVSVGS